MDRVIEAGGDPGAGRPSHWRRIAEAIEGEIARGLHPPGRPLPTVLDLARRFGVNRHTVRQALLSLQSRGLLSLERGRGTYPVAREIEYRLGRQVRLRGNLAGTGVEAASEILWARIAPLPPGAAQRLQLPESAPGWEVATRSFAGRQPLSLAHHWVGAERFEAFGARLEDAGSSITAALASYGHGDYVRLSTRLEARSPRDEEARLLGLPPGVPVLVSEGLDGAPSGDPLHLVTSAFAAQRVRFVVEPETLVSREVSPD